jgi:hypothetical protein
MVVTVDNNTRVADNKNAGFSEDNAKSDAKRRNDKAEAIGIKERYAIMPFEKNPHAEKEKKEKK